MCIVYAFFDKVSNECIYVGSSVVSFYNRLGHHYIVSETKRKDKLPYTIIHNIGGWDNIYHKILYDGELSKKDLLYKERHFIDELKPSGNVLLPIRTDEEWREYRRIKSSAQYYRHHDERKEENRVKVLCECGETIVKALMARHKKRILHKNNMLNKENEPK